MGSYTTHATLLARLADDCDPKAWSEFVDRYGKLIRGFASRYGLQDADCDEVVSEVLAALSRSLPGFRYDPAKGLFRAHPQGGDAPHDREESSSETPRSLPKDRWSRGRGLRGHILKRHRLAFGAGTLFVLLLVGFGIAMSVLYRRATLEARKLEQSLVFLEDTFGSVEKSDTGEPVSVHSLLDEAVHWIAIALDGEPEVEASIRITLGNGYRGLGLFDDARRQLLRARDLHEQHPPSDEHPDHARSLNALGLLYRDLGRLERAEEYFRSALEVRKRAFGESSVRTSASYQNIASIATRRGYIPRAIELLGTAHALRSTHYGDEHPNTAMTVFQLAESYAGLLQWAIRSRDMKLLSPSGERLSIPRIRTSCARSRRSPRSRRLEVPRTRGPRVSSLASQS